MPKPKKLTKREQVKYKKKLFEIRDELFSEINQVLKQTMGDNVGAGSSNNPGYSFHMADLASDQYEKEFLMKLASNEREMLFRINDALKRIESGTYGVCRKCHDPIAKGRLDAIPYATFCKKCRQAEEENSH